MIGFADDTFRFDENGRKLFKLVENTVGKGEIAHYEQFLLFPQCFQKACFPGTLKGVIVRVKPVPKDKSLEWSKFKAFADGVKNVTEKLYFVLGMFVKIVGKGENAVYQHFYAPRSKDWGILFYLYQSVCTNLTWKLTFLLTPKLIQLTHQCVH